MHEEQIDADKRDDRLIRPLAGIAIAASVALAGVLGLRQWTDAEDVDRSATDTVLVDAEFPTQPEADDLLRQYRLLHDAQTSDLGANSINARLTAFEMLEDDAAELTPAASDGTGVEQAEDRDSE